MNAATGNDMIQRKSDRELVVTRMFNAPRATVFKAWSDSEIFKQWWVPKSFPVTLLSCEMDARTGGSYTLVFSHPAAPEPFSFFGKYLEVEPPARIVWTNDEAGDGGQVTTVTFEEQGGKTLVVVNDLYASKAALDEAMASGSINWNNETFEQLDAVLG